jgi:Beta-glucosidase-related glycosidases
VAAPRAAILGCAGLDLAPAERAFFADADPWGFILFARNVDAPDRLSALCADLRDAVGRAAPIPDRSGGRTGAAGSARRIGRSWQDAGAMAHAGPAPSP